MLCLKTSLCPCFVLIRTAALWFWLTLKLHVGKWRWSKMWLIIDCLPGTSLIPAITLFSHDILNRKELSVLSQELSCPMLLKGVCLRAFITAEMLCSPMWQCNFVFLKSKFLIDQGKGEMKRMVEKMRKGYCAHCVGEDHIIITITYCTVLCFQ